MAVTADNLRPAASSWRTPLVIIICGCAIALLGFGPRSSLGFFIQPMSRDFTWGRDVFGLALALQNLLWGLGQPIAGAIADRFGLLRVMVVGALLYAGGLLMMRYATTPASLDLGTGVMIGETAVIGNNVMLYGQVTLGATGWWRPSPGRKQKRHPTIEDDVTIGVGAAILGPITIGNGSKIGAMAQVLESVPPNSVVASKPAELLVKGGETLHKHQELTQGWNGEMDYQI